MTAHIQTPQVAKVPSQAVMFQSVGGSEDWMPPLARLDMPIQDLSTAFIDPDAPISNDVRNIWQTRMAVIMPPLILTAAIIIVASALLFRDGIGGFEIAWLALVAVTLFWISFAFNSAVLGLWRNPLLASESSVAEPVSLTVGVLVPMYNESPTHVFGNVAAMAEEIVQSNTSHKISFFLLSDTQDASIALKEREIMRKLRAYVGPNLPIYYRRRTQNTDRKTGNIADWVRSWGNSCDAMLVLDADSLMGVEGIVTLTDMLARNPSLGLIQSNPRLFGAKTIFGRLQQFASAAFGKMPSYGEARWSGNEANYHGHNAIMRTRAFARCAGLPRLCGRNGKSSLITSHDFVEAALLRRAGWGIQMVPELNHTYEEAPTTLIDYILRDRRWCQGNMQHLAILFSAGLHPVTRFHLGVNALTYLMSPAWLLLILMGASFGATTDVSVVQYLTGHPASSYFSLNVLEGYGVGLLALVYVLLVLPKVIAAARLLCSPSDRGRYGGFIPFLVSFLTELLVTMAIAPVLMVQQTRAIYRFVRGKPDTWHAQNRYDVQYGLRAILWFHRIETLFGLVLGIGISLGIMSWWLLPVGVSLIFAPVLSWGSGLNVRKVKVDLFVAPIETLTPDIVDLARKKRAELSGEYIVPEFAQLAAE